MVDHVVPFGWLRDGSSEASINDEAFALFWEVEQCSRRM